MRTFNYKARDKDGNSILGIIEAIHEKQAASLLRDQGYFIITIWPKKESLLALIQKSFSKISENDLIEFTRQFSTMANAGLPITETLLILRDQTKNPLMAKVVDDLLGDIQGGLSLAQSMAGHPQVFQKVYIALIKAGEAAGVLDRVSARLADNLEKNREFKSKTKGAMIYPMIIFVAMMIAMTVMLIFVFPKLLDMYKDFNIPLPMPTQILMKTSSLAIKLSPIILPILIGGFIFLQGFLKTQKGKMMFDQFIFKIPLIGAMQKNIALTEFTRTLSLLASTGIPIIEALNIVAEGIGNAVYQQAIKEAAADVERGLPLGVPISQNPDFPPIVGQMLKVGEESGKMDEVLGKLSFFFEQEAEHLIKGLTTAIEPIVMVLLGIGVAFIVISVILPIYSLTSSIQ